MKEQDNKTISSANAEVDLEKVGNKVVGGSIQYGTVGVTSSPGTISGKEIPSPLKIGDTVIYSKYGGTEVKVDGKDILAVKQADVLAILE